MNDDAHQDGRLASLLLPGWRHPHTGKIHIRPDCRAVQYHAPNMRPILIRLDDRNEMQRVVEQGTPCRYCFPES